MKKPDISKQGLKRFFLYHSEKLILGLSLGLLGLFFWMGYGSPVFTNKTPQQLADLANQADQYIVSGTSWEMISELPPRKADKEIVRKINEGNSKIDSEKYLFDAWSVKALTLKPRNDPALREPVELMAQVFTSPVIISPSNFGSPVTDPMADLPMAIASTMSDDMGGMGGMDPGMGGFGGPGGRGGFGGFGPGQDKKSKDKEKELPKIDAGTAVLSIHEKTMPGLRPTYYSLNPMADKAFIMNVVSVTGVVDIDDQWKNYTSSFADGIGYYPSRDKPTYEYMEVQRAEVIDGKESEWVDITEDITMKQPSSYPRSLKKMPMSMYGTSPEPVAADCFDPKLTLPIPPLTHVDYRPFVLHPKVESREFDPLSDGDERQEFEKAADIFGQSGKNQNTDAYGGFGMGGMGDGQLTKVRSGSDISKYVLALEAKKAAKKYKLVRFFDLQAKPDTTYRYRVRVWLKDPNHEPTAEELALLNSMRSGFSNGSGEMGGMGGMGGGGKGGRGMGGMGPGMGGMGPGMGDMGGGEMGGGEMGMGGMGGMGMGMGGGPGANEPVYQKIPITHQMKDPLVRSRLELAREVVDPKNQMKITYFVTEFRTEGEGEDRKQVKDEVQVPVGHEELRFARPTVWSTPIEVVVKPDLSSVIAGEITPARTVKIGANELAEGEPVTEVVPTVWSKKYRALLPARKQAYRADALDFSANVHVMNSITWGVHRYDDAPILTETVLVDMLGGGEIDLPRTEPMRHRLPSEMLIMNADGTFDIANDLQDKADFVNALLLVDDKMEVNAEKAAKQRQKELDKSGGGKGFGSGEGDF